MLLSAQNITKVYRDKGGTDIAALNHVNLSVEIGDFIAIMGPSGSGKTTLLNVLSGIDGFDSGSLKISDNNIRKMSKNDLALFRRRRLGFVFQEFNLLDSLTMKENIMLPLILDGKLPKEMESRVQEVATLLSIDTIIEKYPYNVSGGQQQRAAICRAIINNPDILFADEPTGNLDSKSSKAVMECFRKLNEDNADTILLVTHDVYAASYARKVVFLRDGTVEKELYRQSNRISFYDEILNYLAEIGGDSDDA